MPQNHPLDCLKSRNLKPDWLDPALRAAGVLKGGERL